MDAKFVMPWYHAPPSLWVLAVKIGPHQHPSRVVLAPMAGVTDRPFRDLCRTLGAHWAVGEMLTSDLKLWSSVKSSKRRVQIDETEPRWVQIAGSEPTEMARAAQACEAEGAQIIDLNMGCPAKKVCHRAAGSALMRDEALVERILTAVVSAVSVPVTLKMRLGWSLDQQNAVTIAQMAESIGIQLLTVHGRSRACRFECPVHYDRIAEVRQAVSIPLIANGDIQSAAHAEQVLAMTGAAGVMIGRAAQGKPWLPGLIDRALSGEAPPNDPGFAEQVDIVHRHVRALHEFYEGIQGVRIARKHVNWFLDNLNLESGFKQAFNQLEAQSAQRRFLDRLSDRKDAA